MIEQNILSREDALRRIQEITGAIEASNRFFISGLLIIYFGITILTIPAIEWGTRGFTFGKEWGPFGSFIVPAFHVIFYLALFYGVRWAVEKAWPEDKASAPHPLLHHALAFHRPILAAMCGTILVMGALGQADLIYPFIYVDFGILLYLYGRFSSRVVGKASWTYIVLGFIYAYLTKFGGKYLWIYFNTYLGLSFIVMGTLVRKEKLRS